MIGRYHWIDTSFQSQKIYCKVKSRYVMSKLFLRLTSKSTAIFYFLITRLFIFIHLYIVYYLLIVKQFITGVFMIPTYRDIIFTMHRQFTAYAHFGFNRHQIFIIKRKLQDRHRPRSKKIWTLQRTLFNTLSWYMSCFIFLYIVFL